MAGPSRIFLSFRFAEAHAEAKSIKQELLSRGISTFLCDVPEGQSIPKEIASCLVTDAELVVVLGSKTYGKETSASYSTHLEMSFIMESKKPFFLIQMCDAYDEPLTQLYFNGTVSRFADIWIPGTPMPAALIDRICERLGSKGSGPSAGANGPGFNSGHTPAEMLMNILCKQHSDLLQAQEEHLHGLDIYVPLQYGMTPPPLPSGELSCELDALIQALVCGSQADLDAQFPIKSSGMQNSARVVLVQGAAGTGKSLFLWRIMQNWDQRKAAGGATERIPLLINLAAIADNLLERFEQATVDNGALSRFLMEQIVETVKSLHYEVLGEALLTACSNDSQRLAILGLPFLFLLDGLDEVGKVVAVNRLFDLGAWRQSVVVVCSRTGFLSDAENFVAPILDARTRKPSPAHLRQVFLLPFSLAQRDQYIVKFAAKNEAEVGWDQKRYNQALGQFPDLLNFLDEPLLVFMVLHVLPSLVHSFEAQITGKDSAASLRLDGYVLEVCPAEEAMVVYPKIRRAELYSLFAYSWAKREVERSFRCHMSESDKTTKRLMESKVLETLLFCEDLAFAMFRAGVVRARVLDSKPLEDEIAEASAEVAHLLSNGQHAKAKKASALLEKKQNLLLSARSAAIFAKLKQLHSEQWSFSPLRTSSDQVCFLHKTLQEYFVAMRVARTLNDARAGESGHTWVRALDLLLDFGDDVRRNLAGTEESRLSIFKLPIAEQLLTKGKDAGVLRFCADLVDRRVQEYIQGFGLKDIHGQDANVSPFSCALWDVVQASRKAPTCAVVAPESESATGTRIATAAANCMMVLNTAGLIFSGCDLSNVRLGGVNTDGGSFANLSGGIFNRCNMRGADLHGANLASCCFDNAVLSEANLDGVDFGQLPTLQGHVGTVRSVCVTPDGQHILSGSFDNTVRVWLVRNGECLRRLEGHTSSVMSVCVTPDGQQILSGSHDKTVRVWSLGNGECLLCLKGHASHVMSVCVTPDGQHIVSGSKDNTVRVWSLSSGECLRRLEGHTETVRSVCVTPDGLHIVSGSADKTLRMWLLSSGECFCCLEEHLLDVMSVCVTPDGQHIVSGSDDKTVLVWSVNSGKCLRRLVGHTKKVRGVCVTPDGEYIVSGSDDNTVRIWSVNSDEDPRCLEGHTSSVMSVCVTPDGQHIVSASKDNTLRGWSVSSGECLRRLEWHTSIVMSVCVTSDGQHIVSGSKDKTVRVWSLSSGECLRRLEGHIETVMSVCVTPDGQHIVSGSDDKTVRVWSVSSGECLRRLKGHTSNVRSVCVTPDGKYIVSGSDDKTLQVWLLSSSDFLRRLKGHTSFVMSVCVTPDGQQIVSGSGDNTVRLWCLHSGKCLRSLEGHTSDVRSVCVTPDGQHIVSGSKDNTVRVWSVSSGICLRRLEGHTSNVRSVCVTPDGQHIVSGSFDNTLRMWSLSSGECLRRLEGHTSYIMSVCVTPDGQHVVSGSDDKTVRVWSLSLNSDDFLPCHTSNVMCLGGTPDGQCIVTGSGDKTMLVWSLSSGQCLRRLEGHTETVWSVCVTPDGKHVVSGSADKTVRMWSVSSGECLHRLKGHTSYVMSVCVTPDGQHIVSGSFDKTVRVWSVSSGKCLRCLEGHTSNVMSVCVSPDGQHIVSGSNDRTVRVWLLSSGDCLNCLEGHTKRVMSVCVTPDGQHIVSGSMDFTVRVWSVSSGECRRCLQEHTSFVRSVCVTPDGQHILSGSADNSVRLWSLSSGECLRRLEGNNSLMGVYVTPDGHHIVSVAGDNTMRVWSLSNLNGISCSAGTCVSKLDDRDRCYEENVIILCNPVFERRRMGDSFFLTTKGCNTFGIHCSEVIATLLEHTSTG